MPLKDATWLSPDGGEMSEDGWNDPSGRRLGLQIPDVPQGIGHEGADSNRNTRFILLFSSHPEPSDFKLPPLGPGEEWEVLINTARPGGTDGSCRAIDTFPLEGRSAVLLRSRQTA